MLGDCELGAVRRLRRWREVAGGGGRWREVAGGGGRRREAAGDRVRLRAIRDGGIVGDQGEIMRALTWSSSARSCTGDRGRLS